jgi:uncharacterized membrane protein HdeD (DUF308 family)
MNILERFKAPTPKFWKKVQKVGLVLTGLGTFIITAPISLPVTVVTIGGYAAFGGGLIATLSQLTVKDSQNV